MFRIEIQSRQAVAPVQAGGPEYEILRGVFHGALDPADPHNSIITDLEYAPRNARGLVEYSATFTMGRPVDSSRASGVLLYDVPNRGIHLNPLEADTHGHVRLVSGWQSDLVPATGLHLASVPVARGRNGESITGPVFARFIDVPEGAPSVPLAGSVASLKYFLAPPVSLDARRARLFYRSAPGANPVEIAPEEWAFSNSNEEPFPGRPDEGFISLRGGFKSNAAYGLIYEGKDPKVQGVGFAATRDLISFLRHTEDSLSATNPLAGLIRKVIGFGVSQAGNYLKTFLHLGFNADVQDRIVFDGVHLDIAGRHVPLNVRFGAPGALADDFDLGSEGVLWWSPYDDHARGLGRASLLDRCLTSGTCPKIMETFGSAELWNLRMSPTLVGTDASADLPLPDNVRRYYFPSVMHGSSWNQGFTAGPRTAAALIAPLRLPANPNSSAPTHRVLKQALVDWVSHGKGPPPSRYPMLGRGDLVAPTASAMGWPAIPNAPVPDGKLNEIIDHDLGDRYRSADVSGIVSLQPPRFRKLIPALVPRVNEDGNETAGLPSVQLLVPLGTYLGWNEVAAGFNSGRGFSFVGGFIPFSRTRAERVANNDPRPSLQERYGDHAGFVERVRQVAAEQVTQGWLLHEDAEELIAQAQQSSVLL